VGLETALRHNCEKEIGSDLVSRMASALTTSEGWWHGTPSGFGGTLHVYSKPEGIAFRLYFGD
jgi:hypothetical protein